MENNSNKNLEWWMHDRFGMFIHLGIYAVAQGRWKERETTGLVEWMQYSLQIPLAEYREQAKDLTLENFDAKQYVQLAKAAGMKYVVFTAKHHDGFAMYDSKSSDYNVVNMCPAHRDIARELADEVRSAGLKMCFYYSQALDWEDPNAFGNTWDFREEDKVYRNYLEGKCKAQLKELLTEYGEISMIWFDMPQGMLVEESQELKAYVKQFQPECLVSGRIHMDPTIGDFSSMGDNEFPSGKLVGNWETPATLNNTWGYRESDQNWKDPQEILRLLVELLSKGMNYLLNIGPMPDGSIPQKSVHILTELGKWIKVNEEAVYGTTATPYDFDFPWGRISQKGHAMYLYLFRPMDRVCIPGIENQIKRISVLTAEKAIHVPYEVIPAKSGKTVNIELPQSCSSCFTVVKMELDGIPRVKQGLYQLPDGSIHLYSHMARLHKVRYVSDHKESKSDMNSFDSGTSGREAEADALAERHNIWIDNEFCVDPNGNILNWYDVRDFAEWQFELHLPGTYDVYIQTRAAKYAAWRGGHLIAVIMESQKIESRIEDGERIQNAHSRYFEERKSKLGSIQVDDTGSKQLILRLLELEKEEKAGLLVTKMELVRRV